MAGPGGGCRLEPPARPSVPLAFWALVAGVAGLRAVLVSDAGAGALTACAAAAVVAALVAAGLLARRGSSAAGAACVLGAVCAAACATGGLELARQRAVAEALAQSPVSAWEFELAADMTEGGSGWRGRTAVLGPDGRRLGTVWAVAAEPLRLGDRFSCVGRWSPNEAGAWGDACRMQGIAGTVRVVRVLERRNAAGPYGAVLDLRDAVLASFEPASSEARAVLAGSVCGSVTQIARLGLDDAFAACGVSHLVAVSGGHLVVVAACVGLVLDRLSVPPALRAAGLLAVTGAFVAFCGAPSSAVRSWAMSLVATLAQLAGRRGHPLSAVSVVGLAMALTDPGVTGQLGYLLSVICVCGICLFGGYARYLLDVLLDGRREVPRVLRGRWGRKLLHAGSDSVDALALTLVSQAATLPLTCATFSQFSVVAPLANVVLAGPFSALISLGLVAAALVWAPPLQRLALAAVDVVGTVLMWLVRACAALPLASVAVEVNEGAALAVLAACACALYLWWPRPSRRVLAAVVCAALLAVCGVVAQWRWFAPACVRVLDVGQADAILVTDGGAAVLVDTGADDAVVSALARNHVLHLDAVVITHLHADHVGGLDDLLATVDVGRVVVAEGVAAELGDGACGLPVEELRAGDVLRAGGFELAMAWPTEPVDGSQNEHSIELAVTYERGGASLTGLLTGDAEKDVTAAVVAEGAVGDVDFLKVGHHGSAVSIDEATAAALAPELSVASAGEGNSYGHPTPECVAVLEGVGSEFVCTKDVGDVRIDPGADGPRVTYQYPPTRADKSVLP